MEIKNLKTELRESVRKFEAFEALLKEGKKKPWIKKAQSLCSQGKYDEAELAYDRAIEIDPYDANIWHEKGIIFEKLNRTTEAYAAIAKAIMLGYKSRK
jgi:Flp pilus assembly protein TadD